MVYPLRDTDFQATGAGTHDPDSGRSGRIAQAVPRRQSKGLGMGRPEDHAFRPRLSRRAILGETPSHVFGVEGGDLRSHAAIW
jgi:hypothetical protein